LILKNKKVDSFYISLNYSIFTQPFVGLLSDVRHNASTLCFYFSSVW
jgi:hypothetical protein